MPVPIKKLSVIKSIAFLHNSNLPLLLSSLKEIDEALDKKSFELLDVKKKFKKIERALLIVKSEYSKIDLLFVNKKQTKLNKIMNNEIKDALALMVKIENKVNKITTERMDLKILLFE